MIRIKVLRHQSEILRTLKSKIMIYVIFYYIISTLVYFLIGTGFYFWAVFNMASVLMSFTIISSLLMNKYTLKNREYAWLEFSLILSIGRSIYTTACGFAPFDWIYFNNKLFAVIFILWLIIKIIRHRGI